MGKFFDKLLKASTIAAVAGAAGIVAYNAFKNHIEASKPTSPSDDDETCECEKPTPPPLDLNDEALKDLNDDE